MEIVSIYIFGQAGWFSIMSGLFGIIIYADQVADGIGWPLNSGFLGFWVRSFWLHFLIAKTTLMWGAGLTHIIHMVRENNFSSSNTLVIVYWDFLLPIILIILYTMLHREKNRLGASQ